MKPMSAMRPAVVAAKPVEFAIYPKFGNFIQLKAFQIGDFENVNDNDPSLTMRFTKAHDLSSITSVFSGNAKAEMDPEGRVRERSAIEIAAPVSTGRAFLANDNDGAIRFIALTSEYLSADNPDSSFAELGAVMCNLGGYGLAQACISALALKQSRSDKTPDGVYARVAEDNVRAYKIFANHLGWDKAGYEESRDELFKLHQPAAHAKKNRVWFHFGAAAQEAAIHTLTEIRESGVLLGRDGHPLKVQLEGLDL